MHLCQEDDEDQLKASKHNQRRGKIHHVSKPNALPASLEFNEEILRAQQGNPNSLCLLNSH